MAEEEVTAEFRRGWAAALQAAAEWHRSQAKQALILSRRSRFPKNHERDAELHGRAAELVVNLNPDDV